MNETIKGSVQNIAGRGRDAALRNPAATIAVVAGVAFMLGAQWARRD